MSSPSYKLHNIELPERIANFTSNNDSSDTNALGVLGIAASAFSIFSKKD